MQVIYKDLRTGEERLLDERDAKILTVLKHGTYRTRSMAQFTDQKPIQAEKFSDISTEEFSKIRKVKSKPEKDSK